MLATHTAPSPIATDRGSAPTGTSASTGLLCGSTRDTVSSPPFVTQTQRSSTATSSAGRGRGCLIGVGRLRGSSRSSAVGARDPRPRSSRSRRRPRPAVPRPRIGLPARSAGGVDGVDGVGSGARHPDGRAADGDPGGAVGDLDRRLPGRLWAEPRAARPSHPRPRAPGPRPPRPRRPPSALHRSRAAGGGSIAAAVPSRPRRRHPPGWVWPPAGRAATGPARAPRARSRPPRPALRLTGSAPRGASPSPSPTTRVDRRRQAGRRPPRAEAEERSRARTASRARCRAERAAGR